MVFACKTWQHLYATGHSLVPFQLLHIPLDHQATHFQPVLVVWKLFFKSIARIMSSCSATSCSSQGSLPSLIALLKALSSQVLQISNDGESASSPCDLSSDQLLSSWIKGKKKLCEFPLQPVAAVPCLSTVMWILSFLSSTFSYLGS